MPFVRRYFIEGKYLGSSPARTRFVHAQACPPISNSFCCPFCGRLWAEFPVEDQPFMFWSKCCGLCKGNVFDVPGSTLLAWENELSADYPAAVWRSELLVHLRWYGSTFQNAVASNCRDMASYLSAQPQTKEISNGNQPTRYA